MNIRLLRSVPSGRVSAVFEVQAKKVKCLSGYEHDVYELDCCHSYYLQTDTPITTVTMASSFMDTVCLCHSYPQLFVEEGRPSNHQISLFLQRGRTNMTTETYNLNPTKLITFRLHNSFFCPHFQELTLHTGGGERYQLKSMFIRVKSSDSVNIEPVITLVEVNETTFSWRDLDIWRHR